MRTRLILMAIAASLPSLAQAQEAASGAPPHPPAAPTKPEAKPPTRAADHTVGEVVVTARPPPR